MTQEEYEEKQQDLKFEFLKNYPTDLLINDLINEVKNSNLTRNSIATDTLRDLTKSYFESLLEKVDLKNENNLSDYLDLLGTYLKQLPTLYNNFRKELIEVCVQLDYLNDFEG